MHLARWWGPGGFTNPVCEADPRPGGALRIVMRAPDGAEYPMAGTFRDVDPRRLAFDWTALGARGETLLRGTTTVLLRARDARTELTVVSHGIAVADGAAAMLAGMEAGWTQSIERLAAVVAGRSAEAAGTVTKLYYSELLAPRKVCALARHLDAPVQFVRLDPLRGEVRSDTFRAVNPNAKVPALVDDGQSIWESGAIMVHLARRAGSPMWPEDARQVDVLRWMLWDATHFGRAAGSLYFEYVIKSWFGLGGPDPAAVAEATDGFRAYAGVLDQHLAARDVLVGDALTLADFVVANGLAFHDVAHMPLADFPAVARWYGRLAASPAWREPFPAVADALA